MTTGELIGSTLAMISMAGGLVAIYVAHERKMATNAAEINYLKSDVAKLQIRVGNLEDKLSAKIDLVMEKLGEIQVKISKI